MRPRSLLAIAAIVAGVVAAVAALVISRSHDDAPRAAPAVNRGLLPTSPSVLPRSRPPSAVVGHPVPSGSRLRIPALHVDAPVGSVTAASGVMKIPEDPHRVAWWRDGATPGGASGSAVIVGHINFHGVSGALASLTKLRPGRAVTLSEPGYRTLRYRVSAVRTYPKARGLPPAVFARDGVAQLALITCGGRFDASTGNYEDNVVAYAVPV